MLTSDHNSRFANLLDAPPSPTVAGYYGSTFMRHAAHLLGRWRGLLGSVLAGAILAVAVSAAMPRTYTAEALIQLDVLRSTPDSMGSLAGLDLPSLAESDARLLRARSTIINVARRLNLDGRASADGPLATIGSRIRRIVSPDVAILDRFERSVIDLDQKLTVTTVPRSYSISVAVAASSPHMAAELANAFAREFFKAKQLQNLQRREAIALQQLQQLSAVFGELHPQWAAAKANFEATSTQVAQDRAALESGVGRPPAGYSLTSALPNPVPSSPRPLALLALFMSGALATFIAACLELDRRRGGIAGAREVPASLGLRCFGTIPEHAGSELRADALQRTALAVGLDGAEGSPRCILLAASLADDGEQSLAAAFAEQLSRSGTSVLVIDATRNPRCPATGEVVTLASALADPEGAVERLANSRGSAWLLRCADEDHPAPLARRKVLERMLAVMRQSYPVILVLAPPVNVSSDALLLGQVVDEAVLAVRINATSRHAVSQAADQLRAAGVPVRGVILVEAAPDPGAGKFDWRWRPARTAEAPTRPDRERTLQAVDAREAARIDAAGSPAGRPEPGDPVVGGSRWLPARLERTRAGAMSDDAGGIGVLQGTLAMRASWSLADQVIVSLGNVLVHIVLARHLAAAEYGVFALLYGAFLTLQILNSSFFFFPHALQVAGTSGERREQLFSNMLAFVMAGTLVMSLAVAVLVGALVRPQLAFPAANCFLLWQLHEATRRGLLADFRHRVAAIGDVVAYVCGPLCVLAMSGSGTMTLELALVILAAGYMAGALLNIRQVRLRVPNVATGRLLDDNWIVARWYLTTSGMLLLGPQLLLWTIAYAKGAESVAALQAVLNIAHILNPLIFGLGNAIPQESAETRVASGREAAWRAAQKYIVLGLLPALALAGVATAFPERLLALFYGTGSPFVSLTLAVQILALAWPLRLAGELMCSFLLSVEAGQQSATANAAATVCMLIAGWLLGERLGIAGYCLGFAIGHLVRLTAGYAYIHRLIGDQQHSRPVAGEAVWQGPRLDSHPAPGE